MNSSPKNAIHAVAYASVILLALAPAAALADFLVDNLRYEYEDNSTDNVYVSRLQDTFATRITIPATVVYGGKTCRVTGIGERAFYGCSNLTDVTISESVTSIGEEAFYRCGSLAGVTIRGNVTNDWSSSYPPFRDCTNLTTLVLGKNMTKIGSNMFSRCSGLTDVTIPENVTSIGAGAFDDCSGLTSLTIRGNVTNDWSSSYPPFRDCTNLTTLVLGKNMTKIGSHMFSRCSGLTDVTIPESVTSIGEQAFYGCRGLTSLTIPESITSIGYYAFYGCRGLTSLAILGNITNDWLDTDYVSYGYTYPPFGACENLTTLILGEKMTKIGSYMFCGCSGLTNVTIPESVTNIGESAFSGCIGLTAVHIHDLAAWCGITFGHSSANPLYYAHHLFLDGKEIDDLVIPDGVTSIKVWAFTGCSGLTSVKIPESVTSIEGLAFMGCSGLTSVKIPESVTSIGRFAFSECSGLSSVTIPDGVTSIGESAFSFCSGLSSVTIPESVTSIEYGAFQGCSSLTSVEIPDSVVWLSPGAFEGCGLIWASWYRALANLAAGGGTSGGGSSGGGAGGGGKTVMLTVTNVVVHYVAPGVASDAVTPVTNSTGIVNIITEVRVNRAIAIPEEWAKQYPAFKAVFGTDFSAALTKETGKRDGAGNPMFVWQDFVAGTDPTEPASVFTASITFDTGTGEPVIGWSPVLSPDEAAKREYTVYGKKRMMDPEWIRVDGDASDYNFFCLTVEMK